MNSFAIFVNLELPLDLTLAAGVIDFSCIALFLFLFSCYGEENFCLGNNQSMVYPFVQCCYEEYKFNI